MFRAIRSRSAVNFMKKLCVGRLRHQAMVDPRRHSGAVAVEKCSGYFRVASRVLPNRLIEIMSASSPSNVVRTNATASVRRKTIGLSTPRHSFTDPQAEPIRTPASRLCLEPRS